MSTLGIIAGGGELPRAIARSVTASGGKVHILGILGSTDKGWLDDFPHDWIGLGEMGRSAKLLAAAGAKDILLVGRIDRPTFSEIKLDGRGVLMLPSSAIIRVNCIVEMRLSFSFGNSFSTASAMSSVFSGTESGANNL